VRLLDNKAQALQRAQQLLLADVEYQHPFLLGQVCIDWELALGLVAVQPSYFKAEEHRDDTGHHTPTKTFWRQVIGAIAARCRPSGAAQTEGSKETVARPLLLPLSL
jgi:hypothetical protein